VDEHAEATLVTRAPRARLVLGPGSAPLDARSLDRGVDIELFEGGERYAAESVEVLRVEEEGRVLVVQGPLAFAPVRRRARFREALALPVRIFDRSRQRQRLAKGETADIGGGGARCVLEPWARLEAGQAVDVEIDLEEDAGPFRARGRIAWVRAHASSQLAGLAFEEVEGRGLDGLHRKLYAHQRARAAARAQGLGAG
jgi:c-di-GMP-binding flagellar brake protein YcgR